MSEAAGGTRAVRSGLESWLAETHAWTDAALEEVLGPASAPEPLLEAMRYAVFGGGKRMRPALVRLVCASLGGADAAALRPAVAVELVHAYSLVHDDLPCMDDDDLRRGRPTCHRVFGEALAVLVGDALQAAAFAALAGAEGPARRMAAALAAASGPAGMVGGQALDITCTGAAPELADVRRIHRLKTAALVSAAAELGALAAGAGAERCGRARAYGEALGLAFQAVDDVLDVTGDADTLGKTPGKDERLAKPSLVQAVGLERAREEAAERGAEARRAAAALAPEDGRLVVFCDLLLDRDR